MILASVVAWANVFTANMHGGAAMDGFDFDQEIAWCKERRSNAIGDLREFCTGARQFRNKVDITAVLQAKAGEDIKKLDTIIAVLEKCNRHPP